MITANIIQRTFRLLHNGYTASSYTVDKGTNQFLITAAHVFDGSPEVRELTIHHKGRWINVPAEVVFNSPGVADTIVFRLRSDISPRHPIGYGTAGVYVGGWSYFLGFPFGISSPSKTLNNGYPFPLVKAALVSGLDFERHGLIKLFLDGHNNKGFSGGPVVWSDPTTKALSIIGTISGYVTEAPISSETKADVTTYGTNAGIIEAFLVRDLLQIL